MDAVREVVTVPASSDTTATIQESTTTFNVNQSNNSTHTHANAHISSNRLTNKTTSNVISNSSSSNSSCSSSSTSSNSSGYGSSTTTPTNNYDLQQTTPTSTPIPTTPAASAEHIIPVATIAAVTPFYNESIRTHNSETHNVQHHHHHHHAQQQQEQHHLLPTSRQQYSQNHLQTNLQQQHHQYLPRQQYYSPYDYQQTVPTPTHNLSGSAATSAVAPYNMIIPQPYEMSSSVVAPSYGASQYNEYSSSTSAPANYERGTVLKTSNYNHEQLQHQHQQQQQLLKGEQEHSKTINQPAQHLTGLLASSKQRSSSLISNSANTNISKPQATATPFYANPTPFYDNFKHKMPLDYHDTYSNPSSNTAVSYHQQQKFYAAAKSQLKEASYGSPGPGLNSKSLYGNTGNFFPGPTSGLNLSSAPYDKYMYSHTPATGYSNTTHLGNETPPEVSNYRKTVVGNTMNSPSWPWGIDYATGNSRSIPPPASHIPTATVAPTHATHLTQNPAVLARDPYYMGHDKYGVKYDKYTAPSAYQQSYVSPNTNRHMSIWPNTPHASNLTPLNDRHLLATGPPPLNSHGLHATPYLPNSSTTSSNSRQSCCSQPYQPQSCYYPASHTVPPRLTHSQSPTVPPATGGYLTAQQSLGQSPHLTALSASCKYGGILSDYGNGSKLKTSNDLYLNTHHYDNNAAPHSFGYVSAHNSQPLYNANAHQSSVTHVPTHASLLANDPLSANPTSYTNDLSLTISNFDNYHSHLDTHLSQQTLSGLHNPQPPPPSYGATVAKRALLDYRKPIQPQPPPPTISEDCYTTLTSRDHYNQQELNTLNTPETTTIFGEYEQHQNNATTLATETLADADREREENNKELNLRDFISNWNDDEEEFQNNEEMNFYQNTVIDEISQTVAVEQEAAAAAAVATVGTAVVVAVEEANTIKASLEDTKDNEPLEEPAKTVEQQLTATLNDPEANQYVNLPDIVIDIEKSNNISSSITTPTSLPTPPPMVEINNVAALNLTNFDVEKELDELNLKKPAQQEIAKDLNDSTDSRTVITPQLSPCKNLATQISFEDLNLEPHNKTVLNATAAAAAAAPARLTTNQSSDLNEQCIKDIEGYESSSSSRHSNESAYEKEYETFINKITSESCAEKCSNKSTTASEVEVAAAAVAAADGEKEIDFEKNVQDFSKFYKRKRKLKEDELKSAKSKKKLKTTEAIKLNNSNFPQVYTKKSRNKVNKSKQRRPHKRKPLSPYYKIIHSIRRLVFHRERRVREYMTELKEKHLPLIKRQYIKNYTYDIAESLFNAKSLQALCIIAINTDEFRQSLMITMAETQQQEDNCSETEEKHICTDPTCETCEVIKSLMEADSFETTSLTQATANNDENAATLAPTLFCADDSNGNGAITILEAAPIPDDLNFCTEEPLMISSELANVQYSQESFPVFDAKDLERHSFHSAAAADVEIVAQSNLSLENCSESCEMPILDWQAKDHFEIALVPATKCAINSAEFFTEIDKFQTKSTDFEFQTEKLSETSDLEIDNFTSEKITNHANDSPTKCSDLSGLDKLSASEAVFRNSSFSEQNSIISANKKFDVLSTSLDTKEVLNKSLINKAATKISPPRNEKFSSTNTHEESESESEDSDSSDSASSSSSSSTEDKSIKKTSLAYKKCNSSSESSSTDTATDSESDTEDETVDTDSQQSSSKNISSNINSAKRERKEMLEEPAVFVKHNNKRQKASSSPMSREKETENINHTDVDSEDGNIPSSSPRIVIRITKSLSPNDQSLRVENVFANPAKIQAGVDNEFESEKKDDNITNGKSSKLSLSQEDSVSQKSVKIQTVKEVEDCDSLEKKSILVSAPLKLVLRRQDFSTEKSVEPPAKVNNNWKSESEDESISHKSLNLNKTALNLHEKQKTLEKKTFKDDEIFEVIKTSCNLLSPRTGFEAFEKLIEPKDETDETEIHESEKVYLNFKSSAKEEEICIEKTLEVIELNESENVSERTSEEISLYLKSSSNTEDSFTKKSLESHNENDSKVKDILQNKPETISTSLKLSPRQATFEQMKAIETTIEAPVNMESEFDKMSTSFGLEQIQEDVKRKNSFQEVPTSSTECVNDTETQNENDEFDNNLEIKSNKVSVTAKLSPIKNDSIDKISSKNSSVISTELEDNTESITKVQQNSKLSPKEYHYTESESEDESDGEFESESECDVIEKFKKQNSESSQKPDNNKKETFSKKTALETIEIYNLTSSESEEENSEDIEKYIFSLKSSLPDIEIYNITSSDSEKEESDMEIRTEDDDPESILSDSESNCDSEYESEDNDENLKPIKKYNNANPIVISDDESINMCDSMEKLRKLSEDSLQQIESAAEVVDSKEIPESATDKENEFVNIKRRESVMNVPDFVENQIILEQVTELNVTKKDKDEKESTSDNHGNLEEDAYSESEVNMQPKKSMYNTEKYVSAPSCFTEDLLDTTDGRMRERRTQEGEKLLLTEQSFTNFKKRDYDISEGDEGIPLEVPKSLENLKGTPKEKPSFLETFDCETLNKEGDCKTYLCTENDVAQKSEKAITEDLNTIQENGDTPEISSQNVEETEAVTPQTISEERIEDVNASLEIKKLNILTQAENKSICSPKIDVTDSEVESCKLLEKSKSLEEILNQNLMEDSILEDTNRYAVAKEKQNISQDIVVESANEELLMAAKNINSPKGHEDSSNSQNDVPEKGFVEPVNANSNISEDDKSFEDSFGSNIMEDNILEVTKSSTISEQKLNIPEVIVEDPTNKEVLTATRNVNTSGGTEDAFKSQNDVPEKIFIEPENATSHVSEDDKSFDDSSGSNIMEDNILEATKSPTISEQKLNISEVIVEDSTNKEALTAVRNVNTSGGTEDAYKSQNDVLEKPFIDPKNATSHVSEDDKNFEDSSSSNIMEDHILEATKISTISELQQNIYQDIVEELKSTEDACNSEKGFIEPENAVSNILEEDKSFDDSSGSNIMEEHILEATKKSTISEQQQNIPEIIVEVSANNEVITASGNANTSAGIEDACKLQNNALEKPFIEPDNLSWNISEEDKSIEDSFGINIMEDNILEATKKSTISEEQQQNISEDTVEDLANTEVLMVERNANVSTEVFEEIKSPASISPVDNEMEFGVSNKENPSMPEEKSLDTKDISPQILTEDRDVNFEAMPADPNLADQNKIHEAAKLLITADSTTLFTSKDRSSDSSSLGVCETTYERKIKEREVFDDAQGNLETSTLIFLKKSNISVNVNDETLETSDDNNAVAVDQRVAEINFTTTNKLYTTEIFEEISNETTAENKPKDSHIALEISENITKTATARSEIFAQSVDVLENPKVENSENTSDNDESQTKECRFKAINNTLKEIEDKHLEGNICEIETKKTKVIIDEKLKASIECNNQLLEENFRSPEDVALSPEVGKEANKDKLFQEITEQEKFASQDILVTDLRDDSMPKEQINQNQNEVSKVCNQIESFTIPSEVVFEKPKSKKENFGIELQSLFKSEKVKPSKEDVNDERTADHGEGQILESSERAEENIEKETVKEDKLSESENQTEYVENSTNLTEVEATIEEAVVNNEHPSLAEEGMILEITEISGNYDERVENDNQTITDDDKLECLKSQANKTSEPEEQAEYSINSNDLKEIKASEEERVIDHKHLSVAKEEIILNSTETAEKVSEEKYESITKDDELECVKPEADQTAETEQQTEHSENSNGLKEVEANAEEAVVEHENHSQAEKAITLDNSETSKEIDENITKDDELECVKPEADQTAETEQQTEHSEISNDLKEVEENAEEAVVEHENHSQAEEEVTLDKSEISEERDENITKDDELECVKPEADQTAETEQQTEHSENSNGLKEVEANAEEAVVEHENHSQAKEAITLDNSDTSEEKEDITKQTIPKDDKQECAQLQTDQTAETEHQTEHLKLSCLKLSCNETSRQNAPTKDSSTSNDMSRDFFGFKNQSSFEDESEDFHGFEDLEEVTRIRHEIENLNDDSTANDGFLQNLTLNRQMYKSSTTSLSDSASSEINEFAALEKELSQHQPKLQVEYDCEDDDKETEKDFPIKPIEIASSNDIEHIKQMLESDEEQQTDGEDKIEKLTHICKNSHNISKDILSSVNSIIPKLRDLCRAALNSSLNSNSNLAQQHTETSTILVERELSVEEALAEMYQQAGVLLSDPEDCDHDMPSPGHNEAHDVLLINLQEILNSDNNDVYVLQCDMNENVVNVVQSTEEQRDEHKDNDAVNTERVNTVQIILDTQNPEPQIHIISSDSESEVIILSDDDSEYSYRPFSISEEPVTIPFINDNDSLFDIPTIHHEEIVPDNLNKFLQEEFYKYLHEKYVQRNISKYYHANRVLKKYKRRFVRTHRQ